MAHDPAILMMLLAMLMAAGFLLTRRRPSCPVCGARGDDRHNRACPWKEKRTSPGEK